MKRVWFVISILVCVIFISGCGTKRQYFEPSNTNGKIRFDGKLSSTIKETAYRGVSLKNGKIVAYNGDERDIKLEKGYSFLGEFDDKYITIAPYGVLHIKDKSGDVVYEKNINSMVAAAAVDKDTLAVVSADNTLYVFDINNDKTVFQKKMSTMASLDSRIVPPFFLGSLVVFPTLDGKLAIVDRGSGNLIRNVIVSAEKDFGNVIFLDVVEDRMFAATSKRVISISPTNISYLDREIKDAILSDDRIFILEKDGNVVLADLDLKILDERKFPFAIFSGVGIKNNSLYMVEKRGYLIKSDLDLKNYEIFKLPCDIEDFLFVAGGKIFYNNRFYTLK